MPVESNLKPKASAVAMPEHLALPYESRILKKIETSNELSPNKLQFCFIAGRGGHELWEETRGEFNMTVHLLIQRGGFQDNLQNEARQKRHYP